MGRHVRACRSLAPQAGFCCGAFLSCAKAACNSNGLTCVNDCGSLTHSQ